MCKEKTTSEKVSDAAKSAGKKAKWAAQDAGKAIGDAAKAAGNAVGDAAKATGNAINVPFDSTFPYMHPLQSVQTLTAVIATELGEAPQIEALADGSFPPEARHYQALFVIGIVLFTITFLINLAADLIVKGIRNRK